MDDYKKPELEVPYEKDTPMDSKQFFKETEEAKLMYQGNRVALPNVNGLARRIIPSA